MKRFVIVTGASSGIGKSACQALARQGYEVLAGLRSSADIERFKAEASPGIYPIQMDVTNHQNMLEAKLEAERIIGENSLVAIFNNAGIVVNGTVLHIPLEEWEQQFDVNVLGLIRTTQLFYPLLMKERPSGDLHPRRIINMSSVSGHFASPFIGPYAASKYAVEALSDSLRRELYMYDIQVVIIVAGKISTPIWEKAKGTTSNFGKEFEGILQYKDEILDNMNKKGLPTSLVDKVVLEAVRSNHPKLRYVVAPNKFSFFLMRYLPARWVDHLIKRKLKEKSGFRPF